MATAPTLTFPTIHLNGSAPAHLIEDYAEAHNAVRVAMEKVAGTGPNKRDYYTQDEGAWIKARQEHQARLERLRQVCEELQALAENIQEQDDARKRR